MFTSSAGLIMSCYTFLVIFLIVLLHCDGQKKYEGWSLIRVQSFENDQLNYFSNLDDGGANFRILNDGGLETPLDILVSPSAKGNFMARLKEFGLTWTMLTENIQQAIDAERGNDHIRKKRALDEEWFGRYLRFNEIMEAIQILVDQYGGQVSFEDIGTSHENRPIRVVKVSSGIGSAHKPAIWIDGGIHSQEWISISTAFYLLNNLLLSGDENLINGADWYFVPVLNPDGYEYTWNMDRFWWKNRRPYHHPACVGVDLNRNFGYKWGHVDDESTKIRCSRDYRGPEAFSEPETRAVHDFIGTSNIRNMQAFITLHSYMQYWFVPFTYKKKTYPKDIKDLEIIAQQGIQAMQSVYGTEYKYGSPADCHSQAGGISMDWAKGSIGIKYSYTLELRPGASTLRSEDNIYKQAFVLSPDQIIPVGEVIWAGLTVVFHAVISQPSSASTSVSPSSPNSAHSSSSSSKSKSKWKGSKWWPW